MKTWLVCRWKQWEQLSGTIFGRVALSIMLIGIGLVHYLDSPYAGALIFLIGFVPFIAAFLSGKTTVTIILALSLAMPVKSQAITTSERYEFTPTLLPSQLASFPDQPNVGWLAGFCAVVIVAGGAGYVLYRVKKFCDRNFAGHGTNENEFWLSANESDNWSAISPVGFNSCPPCDGGSDFMASSEANDYSLQPYVELLVNTSVGYDGSVYHETQYRILTNIISREQFIEELAAKGHPFSSPFDVTGCINGQRVPMDRLPVLFFNTVPHAIAGVYANKEHYVRITVECCPNLKDGTPDNPNWYKLFECVQPTGVEARIEVPHLNDSDGHSSMSGFFRVKTEHEIP